MLQGGVCACECAFQSHNIALGPFFLIGFAYLCCYFWHDGVKCKLLAT
jgi:hypothetical protein